MKKQPFERPVIKKLNTGLYNKFGLKTEFSPLTHIDDVAVKELLDKYGSPLYILSEKTIRQTYQAAKRAFTTRYPKVQFAWSYKTNYLDAVCSTFHTEGSWAEVVSGFEYDKAIRNGVKGSCIIFNGPDKNRDVLTKAIENGSLLHIDHFDEIYTIVELSSKLSKIPRVAVRVNMDTGVYPAWSRFGFNYENGEAWDAINKILINDKVELVGLHCHVGTYIMSANIYGIAAAKLANLAAQISKKFNHTIKYIDMGGGFASRNTLKGAFLPGSDTCPTFDDYAEAITSALINSEIKPEEIPLLILETGRALIDDAGYIAGTVIANKQMPDGKRAMIIDIGVNLLFTSFWYEHKITPAQLFSPYTEDTIIYGPLCMNIDVVRDHISFPILRKGDHVVVSRIGAYNMTQWMQFINLRPNVVMIDEKREVHLVRDRETLQTIVSQEHTPEHLRSFNL